MVKAGFILLTILLALIVYVFGGKLAGMAFTRVSEENKFKTRTALVLIVWLGYVTWLSIRGVFIAPTLPPRIPLLLVIPAFLFFAYLFMNRLFKNIIINAPPSWPVYFQSFRIVVELLLVCLFMQGILPKSATFEGYNYDIIIGLTAPLVGFFMGNSKSSHVFLLIWNCAGLVTLAIVVFILQGHAYFFRSLNENESILGKGFGQFPYIFLAGFFMPLAVFMHVFSIIKTRQLMRR